MCLDLPKYNTRMTLVEVRLRGWIKELPVGGGVLWARVYVYTNQFQSIVQCMFKLKL